MRTSQRNLHHQLLRSGILITHSSRAGMPLQDQLGHFAQTGSGIQSPESHAAAPGPAKPSNAIPSPYPLVFLGFADDRRLVGLLSILLVCILVIIIVVIGTSRWGHCTRDRGNLLDATFPFLLQTSVKLYGIRGHVVFLLTFVFEGGARSGSSPSASAQYISASFRHWRLCRRDFATAARRANFFAFAR